MARIVVLGATGSLGSHVARQAVSSGQDVSLLVRSPARLASDLAARARVRTADLTATETQALARRLEGHDVLVCCAGMVTQGPAFVALFDKVVSAVELLPRPARPVCWFLAGAALLDLDDRGHRGVDLPGVGKTYWPHGANFERLQRSDLDWRLLCPGPMVEQSGIGIERLRISLDRLPSRMPALAGFAPPLLLLPLFARRVPEMIVPYPDAAAVMLANTGPGGAMSRRRVGIALPVGITGKKDRWTAKPQRASR
jgi:putative NADH-flavin reductase